MATLAVAVTIFGGKATADDNAPTSKQATFTRDVAPIFYSRCVECHRAGELAPMSLMTYEEARPWAKAIKKEVASRHMPPFHAEKIALKYRNDTSLTDDQIAAIAGWVESGAPEGDKKDLPLPPTFDNKEWLAGAPDLAFRIPEYTLGANVNDEYRCFVFPTGLNEDAWVQSIEYAPGNRQVCHHIMAYADVTGKARAKDEATPEPGFVCGMSGEQGTTRLDMLLGGWAPGTPPNTFPEGTGRKIPAHADIVYQVHYHNTTGKDAKDRSGMGIIFARKPIQHEQKISLVGSMKLDIKAGDAAATHEGNWRAPYDITLYTVMPHMHFLGKGMNVTATYPDGRKETLVDVRHFDFNWQTVYAFDKPMLIPKGTQLHMVSVHDNSAENPFNPTKPPKEVFWGEATDQEMAHCWLGFVKADEDLKVNPQPPKLGEVAGR